MIRQLPDDVKSYIRSGVAITSITQCVEELLLNAIDAGSTCVAVRVDIGCFKVQVVDNGHGIPAEELPLVGNRYSTSKCHTVSDLNDLRYFGYRGEALASLKDACGVLEIVTRTKSGTKPLCKLFQDGKSLPIKESAIPRPSVGTTVTVHGLFMNFPVRQKAINEGLELEKVRQRVAGLALIKPHVSVRLRNDATGATLIHTTKCSNTLDTFGSLFGQTKAQGLVEVKGMKGQFLIDGFIGREGSTKKDVQFVYINGRLVLKTKIHKVISQIVGKSIICKKKIDLSAVSPLLPDENSMRKSPGKQMDKHPMFVINVICPLTDYDITFDPAKTLVEFKDWDTLLECITEVTNEFMKKEKIPSTETDSSYFNKAEGDGEKYVPVISPCNMKDALISKPAKRHTKKTNINTETPEGVPLEEWKLMNTAPKPIDTTSSTSLNSDCVTVSIEHKDLSLDCSKEDSDSDITNACDTLPNCDETLSNKVTNAIDDKNGMFTNKQEFESKTISEKQITSTSKCCDTNQQASCDKNINENLQTQKFKKPFGRPGSALSTYRKLVGKTSESATINLSERTNIDESLKRISRILPSNKSTENRTISSLQKFKLFASNYSHKVVDTCPETAVQMLPAKFGRINDVPRIEIPHTPVVDIYEESNGDTTCTTEPNPNYQALARDMNTATVHLVRKESSSGITHENYESVSDRYHENTSHSMSDKKRPGGLVDGGNPKVLKVQDSERMTCSYAELSDGDDDTHGFHFLTSDSFQGDPCGKSSILQSRTQTSSMVQLCTNNIVQAKSTNIVDMASFQAESSDMEICKTADKGPHDIKRVIEITNSTVDDNLVNVSGSQLFKNLPDIDTNISQESDNNDGEMFTAVPLDTNQLIHRIISDGINKADLDSSPISTQGFIPGTSSQESMPEEVLQAGEQGETQETTAGDSLQFDTTQEFTPCATDDRQPMEITSHGLTSQLSCLENNMSQCADNESSPGSVGFTPQMGDSCSPDTHMITYGKETKVLVSVCSPHNSPITNDKEVTDQSLSDIADIVELDHEKDSTNCNMQEMSDIQNTKVVQEDDDVDLENNCEGDLSLLTQDTLDMPSILDSSRLDQSVEETGKHHCHTSWCSEASMTDTKNIKSMMVQNNNNQQVMVSQESDMGNVTVTQLLLNVKDTLTPTNGTSRSTDNALTFRDIFTPTQSQVEKTVPSPGNVQQTIEIKHADIGKEAAEVNEDALTEHFERGNNDEHFKKVNVVIPMVKNEMDKEKEETKVQREENKQAYTLKPENSAGGMSVVDEFDSETESCWVETLQPETGKKMFVHSKLGTVMDNVDTTCTKKAPESNIDVIETPLTKINGLHWKPESSVRSVRQTDVISKLSSSSSSSSLQQMLSKHLERQDETDVKWREKPATTTDTSSVIDLFSEWENPVLNHVNKSVMNVETGTITNKSSLKAMKTLHTCTFTKDMLKTVQVIGQLDRKFIVCLIQTDVLSSAPDLLAVIDQHAAHERVRLELLTEEAYVDGNVEKRELAKFTVIPGKPIKVDAEEIQVMMSFRDEFSRIGITFRVDTHTDDLIKVLSVPECLIDKDATDTDKKMDSIYWDTMQTLIKGHVELLQSTEGAKGRMPAIIHKLLCSQACHGAIKFGDNLTLDDCKSLIHDLSLCDLPFQCAHGRPSVMPVLSLLQLDTRLPQKQTQKPQLQKLKLAMNNKKK